MKTDICCFCPFLSCQDRPHLTSLVNEQLVFCPCSFSLAAFRVESGGRKALQKLEAFHVQPSLTIDSPEIGEWF
jgi:hypothetical protein